MAVSLTGDFVWDDRPLIVENSLVKSPGQVPQLLTSSFWNTGDRYDRFRSFFRPLVSMTYALDYAVWGLDPLGFHLSNLALHLACCWLVYCLALREAIPRWPAVAGAGLFAVHPVHVESVAWICGRTDVLCAVFVLGAFLLHRRGEQTGHRAATRLLAWGLFLAALLAKEMAATLPLLVFLDHWLRRAGTGRRLAEALKAALPYFGLLGLYLALRAAVLPGGQPLVELGALSWLATALFVLARYLTLLLVPLGLDAHYPYQPFDSLWRPSVIVAAVMLSIVLLCIVLLRRRNPRTVFWTAWIAIGLGPVLLFGRFGDVVMADRFLYLPSVGLAVLGGLALWRVTQIVRGRRRVAVAVGAGVILATLGALTWDRTTVWRDDHTLFSDMLRTSPDSALVRANLGLALFRRGDLDRAIEQFELAIRFAPGYGMAHNNLAATLELRGRPQAAMTHYRAALDAAPGLMHAQRNLAHLLVTRGRVEEGLSLMRDLLRRHPRSPDALYAAADAFYAVGRTGEALDSLERAGDLDPWHAESHYLLGKIRFEQGRPREAAQAMQRFLELWPTEGENTEAARRVIAGATREPGGEARR
jgi:tetratricopeptide (TPR) repeat protein